MILISKEKCLPYRDTGKDSPGCVCERTHDWCEMREDSGWPEWRDEAQLTKIAKGGRMNYVKILNIKKIRKGYC
jgi:hypothetical protein